MIVNLTEEQKQIALKAFDKKPDLIYITRKVFGDETIDGRDRRGRAVKDFLISQGKEYQTTKSVSKKAIDLTEPQKQFLMSDQISSEMTMIQMARLVFNDPSIKPLSAQHVTVQEFIQKFRADILDKNDIVASENWSAPKALSMVILRINKWVKTNYPTDETKLPSKIRRNAEKLLVYLSSYKIDNTINSFLRKSDRDLFESEFVRYTWDKPDLTNEELNLYMMVCSNHIRAKHTQKRLDKFNEMLMAQEGDDVAVSMAAGNYLKGMSEELNACESRIDKMLSKLNGDRAKRLEKQLGGNFSFLALVEAFQDKEERDKMVKLAEMHNKLIADEAERLETMDEMKARIMGISLQEML